MSAKLRTTMKLLEHFVITTSDQTVWPGSHNNTRLIIQEKSSLSLSQVPLRSQTLVLPACHQPGVWPVCIVRGQIMTAIMQLQWHLMTTIQWHPFHTFNAEPQHEKNRHKHNQQFSPAWPASSGTVVWRGIWSSLSSNGDGHNLQELFLPLKNNEDLNFLSKSLWEPFWKEISTPRIVCTRLGSDKFSWSSHQWLTFVQLDDTKMPPSIFSARLILS